MAYTNTLYHLTFDALPLTDPVGSTVVTTGTATLADGVFGSALSLNGVRVSSSPFTITNKLGIGFWLKPKNQGLAHDPVNLDAEPLCQAVIAQGDVNYSAGSFVANSPTFIVYEETQEDNQNKLVVILDGLDGSSNPVTRKVVSTAYDCDEWHHFFINYDGATTTLTIYIDLVVDAGTATGTVPTTLNASLEDFRINTVAIGKNYQCVQNTGYMDDLVIFNATKTATQVQRLANRGALYVADSSYTSIEEIHQGFIVDDPSTIQITSVFANRGNIYIGRTDGKLLRGVRSLWESRHEFADERELDFLTVVTKTADNNSSVTDGVLKLKNEVIRI